MRALLVLSLLLSSTSALAQEPPADPADAIEAPGASTPEGSTPEDSTPEDSTPEDSASEDSAPEDSAPEASAPATQPAQPTVVDEPAPLPRLELEGCRDLVRRHDLPAARVCYQDRAPGDDERVTRVRQRIAGSLADVHAAPPTDGFDRFGELVTSGKAELIAASTLFGGYLATLAVVDAGFFLFQVLQLSLPSPLQPAALALVLLSPIAGGAAGLAAGVTAHLSWPDMTSGDANLLRASLWLGTFNSVVAGLLANGYGARTFVDWWRVSGAAATTATLAGAVGTLGVGTALALLTDLPEAAGPLGLSFGFWGGTLAVLGQLMFDLPLRFEEGTLLVGAVANAGFAAGLLTAPFIPLTRFETWLLDLGAVAGGLVGTAVVLGVPAPNPVLGYGGIGVGLLLGAGAGVAVGKLVPLGLELVELPRLVAMGPLVLPPGHTGEVPLGAQVSVSLDGALDLLRR